MTVIPINTAFITLSQFLKMTDFVSSGGEVKYFLSSEVITVNGDLEARRGRKLYPEDKVCIRNLVFSIASDS